MGSGLTAAGRPDPVCCPPQTGQLLDLAPAQASIKYRRNGWQQIVDGFLHPADVGLRYWIAVRLEAASQLGLRQFLAGLLFVQLFGFLHSQGPLYERQAAVQLVFREMACQRNDLSAFRPWSELASDAKEPFVPRLAPQLAQDCEASVATVPDDVVIRAGTPGNGRRCVEPTLLIDILMSS